MSAQADTLDVDTRPPFTDFGWRGTGQIDERVFDQAEWWVNIKGKPFKLTEMDSGYLSNVVTFLFAHAEHFFRMYHNPSMLGTAAAPTPQQISAIEWLTTTPLYQAIIDQLNSREAQEA